MGRIEPGNEAKSVTYTMTATNVVSVVIEVNRMAAEINLSNRNDMILKD